MEEIIFLKGLPASGKTTWTKNKVEEDSDYVRINKDDIREKHGNPPWSSSFEKKILNEQRELGNNLLDKGFSIIIDDTNFAKKHWEYWSNIASERGIQITEKFFNVSVDECIKRDLLREKSVGESVIRKINKQNRSSNMGRVDDRLILEQNKSLPSCIICDLDGTLALHQGRSPYDDSKIYTDKLNPYVYQILKRYDAMGVEIIYLSGRGSEAREHTENWLVSNNAIFRGYDQKLYMRPEKDNRKDSIIKKELYDNHIKGKYYVEFVLDDRNQVVDTWREIGLLCLQVYYGDF